MRTLALVMAGAGDAVASVDSRSRQAGGAVRRQISHHRFRSLHLVNSGIYAIYVLVQWRSQSLIEHLKDGWQFGGMLPDHFVIPVPAQMRWASCGTRAPRTQFFRISI